MDLAPLHDRILAIVGDRTYRAIGQITEQNSETVRRYLQGQAPSVEFLVALCSRFDVNAHWLITGHGAMKHSETMAEALRSANPAELLSAVADALERLADRMDRLEVFVQTLDVRVRSVGLAGRDGNPAGVAGSGAGTSGQAQGPGSASGGVARANGGNGANGGPLHPNGGSPTLACSTPLAEPRQRAKRIADALPKRPPETPA